MKVPALRRWLPLAVFVLVPSVLILPILLSGKMLYGADVVSVFHYSRIVIAESFRAGRLPVWDPHVMAGFPLLAELQNAVFYPPTWLCALLPASTFWTLSAWAHLILAGVFAHRWLARGLGVNPWPALAGAIVFMMSGYISGHVYAGHVNYVWAYAWIPAVLWRLERLLKGATFRRGVLLSLAFAMLFLAGVPQYVFCVGLMIPARLVLFVLHSTEGHADRVKRAGIVVAWLALGLALTSPQLLPSLELVGQMHRDAEGHSEFSKDFSLPLRAAFSVVYSPLNPERGGIDSQYRWEWCGFIGGAAFLLGAAAFLGRHPQRNLWLGIALAGLILALGTATPVYGAFLRIVPGATLFRGPGRYLLLFTVAASALASFGTAALWARRGWPFRAASVALMGLAGMQLFVFAHPHFLRVEPTRLKMPPEVEVRMRDVCGADGRVNGVFVEDIGQSQAAGLDHVGGYEPLMLGRYAESMNAARGGPVDMPVVIMTGVPPTAVGRMLGARARCTLSAEFDFPDTLPRVWLVNNAVVIEDKGKRLHQIGMGKWDPGRTVILESYPNEAPPVTTEMSAGSAKVLVKKPGYYEIEAENSADAYLLLSEAYYPGWEADVDGRPVDVLPANHLIQTVRLPAGKHRVRFQYHSRFLGLGFAVAALAALVPVGLLVHRHRRQLALQRLPGAP